MPGRSDVRLTSEEVRASLAAVRVARDAAQIRMRRDTRRVRVLTAGLLVMLVAGVFSVRGHFRSPRRGVVGGDATAGMLVAAPPLSASVLPSPATLPASSAMLSFSWRLDPITTEIPRSVVDAPATATVAAVSVAAGSTELEAERASIEVRTNALAACNSAYDGYRWRTAVAACASAFEVQPRDASLAMKVAQAQHARSHYGDAGVWARRAIALPGVDPEAFVILAHAERRAGHPAAAKNAYRRYLALAPRGWHASEARAAVHASRSEVRTQTTRSGAERAERLALPTEQSLAAD